MSPVGVYSLLFLLLLVEGMGIPGIPFEAVFLAAGYYIQHGRMSFMGAVAVGTLGNLAGNLIGYWLGAMTVPALLKRFLRSPATERGRNIARSWFERYGAGIVVISRWFGPIRTPTIVGAAAMGMRAWPYTLYSLIGAFSWTLAWQYGCWKGIDVVTGWWHTYHQQHTRCLNALLLIAVVPVAGLLIFAYCRRRLGTGKKP